MIAGDLFADPQGRAVNGICTGIGGRNFAP